MFSNAVKLFTIDTFEIRLDPSWLIIAALITWSLSQHYFPDAVPGTSSSVYLVMAICAMLGLFGSLLLHELAHSVVAKRFDVPIKSITLFLFGGVAEMGDEPPSAMSELWIALAGPALSLVLAAGFWTTALIAGLSGVPDIAVEVLSYLALINLVLALFNLVPAFPLDGGRVLRAYLWHRDGDILAATKSAAQSGTIFAFVLMALAILALFQGAFVAGLWQLMIGGFLLVAARTNYTAALSKVAFKGKTVDALMTREAIVASPEMTLAEFVNHVMLRHNISFAPVMEGEVLLGQIDQSVLTSIDRENWANTRVGDVFVGLHNDAMIEPELPVDDLLAIISDTGRRKFLVATDHHLLGVITLSDLTCFLTRASFAHTPKVSHQ